MLVVVAETERFDMTAVLNERTMGWVHAMGIVFEEATADVVRCRFEVREEHLQAYGIVHGGVHSGVIETLASVGAAVAARPSAVVGLENSTSFIRAVRAGAQLRATARPVTRGRRTQVWEARVEDDAGRLVATGRVRLLVMEAPPD